MVIKNSLNTYLFAHIIYIYISYSLLFNIFFSIGKENLQTVLIYNK